MNTVLSMVLLVVFVLLVAAFAWGVDYLTERWKRKRRERTVGKCLPCPVCRKKERLHMVSWTKRKGRRFWFVRCERCGKASMADRRTPALAVRSWNEMIYIEAEKRGLRL